VAREVGERSFHRCQVIDQASGQGSYRDCFHLLQHGLQLGTNLRKHPLHRRKKVLKKTCSSQSPSSRDTQAEGVYSASSLWATALLLP